MTQRVLFLILFVVMLPSQANADLLRPIHRIELGVSGGAMLTEDEHELYDNQNNTWRALNDVAPGVAMRFGYLPWAFVGAEVEGAYWPTGTEDGFHVNLWAVRGHLLLQYPWLVTPFAVVGGGMLAVASSGNALGDNMDSSFHYGAGLKYDLLDWLGLRFDFRHDMTARRGPGGTGHFFEFWGGFTFRLFEVAEEAAPALAPDSDDDGFVDAEDACPNEAAPDSEDGCPPPADRDGDGFTDDQDNCPDVAGENQGCPPDADGDGVFDADDKCPDVAGPAPDGCPLDPDGDGIVGEQDQCPNKPETVNNFQDQDGCPDVLPDKIKAFTGTIGGITFALGKADIKRKSRPALDTAAATMEEYPKLRVLIRGHTDNTGKVAFNEKLSLKRAEAVRRYLVGKGVAQDRIEVEGVGPAEPIETNDTAKGRAANRRIEFRTLKEAKTAKKPPA